METLRGARRLVGALGALGAGMALAAPLPALNLDLQQTTVSGISSGAFMAVQLAVAKSASVKGVAATAGGPYACALDSANGLAVINPLNPLGVATAIGRCMQGDPSMPAQPITPTLLGQMVGKANTWAQQGRIDPVANLGRQAVWVFHGYNDGIVKQPVSQALVQWYGSFAPASQVFHKDNLNAAHAQISTGCNSQSAVCNTCATTGGQFINTCPDQPAAANGAPYDAAGAALQMFYGPLQRTATAQLGSRAQAFSQLPYLKWFDGKSAVSDPKQIAMGDTGYVYVPQACAQGQPCRLHIAFHGCMQSAVSLGSDTSVPAAQRNPRAFVDDAGLNEWADANRLVVLYPQAQPTQQTNAIWPPFAPLTPTNPMGCWDWWGYNDIPRNSAPLGQDTGTYATARGVQIAAVWRMAEQLAAQGQPGSWADATGAIPVLQALDQSDDQVLLRWQAVSGASGYRVYRSSGSAAPQPVGGVVSQPFWADGGLPPQTRYRYTVRAVVGGQEGPESNAVSVGTSRPTQGLEQCNPYFSLALNHVVTATGQKTDATCP